MSVSGRQDLLLAGALVKPRLCWPAFKADPALLEFLFDQGSVMGVQNHVVERPKTTSLLCTNGCGS